MQRQLRCPEQGARNCHDQLGAGLDGFGAELLFEESRQIKFECWGSRLGCATACGHLRNWRVGGSVRGGVAGGLNPDASTARVQAQASGSKHPGASRDPMDAVAGGGGVGYCPPAVATRA